MDAGNKLGLIQGGVGFEFVGDYETKGCYAYSSGKDAGSIFYGTGGSPEDRKTVLSKPKYRPNGYDCSTKGTMSIIFFTSTIPLTYTLLYLSLFDLLD